VTSWSSASTSFVIPLTHARTVAPEEAERQALQVPEEAVAKVESIRSPVQPVK
jgi:hypothetical protein